jgi:hypothetical protein
MMPWFAFDRDFDFRPSRSVMLAYKGGQTLLIPTATAEAAEAAGVGKRAAKPKADDAGA